MNIHSNMPQASAATPAVLDDDELHDLDIALEAEEAKAPEPPKTGTAESNTVLKTASKKPKQKAKPSEKQQPAPEIYKEGDKVFISPALQKDMDAAAIEIRKLHGNAMRNIAAVGVHLIKMKDRLKHGEFAKWYVREFGWDAMTASRYMRAARAWGAIRQLEPEAKIDLLPPTLLYDFDKLSDDQQLEIAEAAKAGEKLKAGDFKKQATSKKTSAPAPASTDKGEEAAEALAKIIVEALHHAVREKIAGHAGFRSPAFGALLQKEIAGSFGVSSKEAA